MGFYIYLPYLDGEDIPPPTPEPDEVDVKDIQDESQKLSGESVVDGTEEKQAENDENDATRPDGVEQHLHFNASAQEESTDPEVKSQGEEAEICTVDDAAEANDNSISESPSPSQQGAEVSTSAVRAKEEISMEDASASSRKRGKQSLAKDSGAKVKNSEDASGGQAGEEESSRSKAVVHFRPSAACSFSLMLLADS